MCPTQNPAELTLAQSSLDRLFPCVCRVAGISSSYISENEVYMLNHKFDLFNPVI